jgi:hypothetical protein
MAKRLERRGRNGGERMYVVLVIVASLAMLGCTGGGSTSAAVKASPEQVMAHLKSAGLPITSELIFTAENEPNQLLGRPRQYTAKGAWKDSRIRAEGDPGLSTGGSVEIFANEGDRKSRQDYIATVATSPLLAEYAYAKGVVLVRVSKGLTPAQASDYEKAVASLP